MLLIASLHRLNIKVGRKHPVTISTPTTYTYLIRLYDWTRKFIKETWLHIHGTHLMVMNIFTSRFEWMANFSTTVAILGSISPMPIMITPPSQHMPLLHLTWMVGIVRLSSMFQYLLTSWHSIMLSSIFKMVQALQHASSTCVKTT